METVGYFSADLTDLHDSEVELLQFNERGKLLIQWILFINAGAQKGSGARPGLVGPLGLEPRTS